MRSDFSRTSISELQNNKRSRILKNMPYLFGTSACPRFVFLKDLEGGEAHTHTCAPDQRFSQQVSLIDQCEWHRMTRMTGPDCAVMCNLINTHTHTHTHTHTDVAGPD